MTNLQPLLLYASVALLITMTPALHERELAKLAVLAETLADALEARGVADLRAELAAQAGMAAFVQAVLSWLDDSSVELPGRFDLAFNELRSLFTEKD